MGNRENGSAMMIRITPEDYDRWLAEFDGPGVEDAWLEYGITKGPLYRDVSDPNTVLVHFNVEDVERAQGWFADDRFKAAAERAGGVTREVFIAERQ